MRVGKESTGQAEAPGLAGMKPFFTVFPKVSAVETAALVLREPMGKAPADEYGFVEFYCADSGCDCRRVFFEVWSKSEPGVVWARINFGWESEAFYLKKLGMAEMAREVRAGALDPLYPQSERAEDLLKVFQELLISNAEFVGRLGRHYQMFKNSLKKGEVK